MFLIGPYRAHIKLIFLQEDIESLVETIVAPTALLV
jgi:hypothetical protein